MRKLYFTTAILLGIANATLAADVSFNKDILPILSDKCFTCHGPDANARKADLRLDVREDALEVLSPDDVATSELINRITTDDADLRMPPPESTKQLKPAEIKKLKQWIAEGAKYEKHWSFEPIAKPKVPTVKNKTWVKNEIDAFILHRLEQEGMQPSPQADDRTLLRRITLDVTGLPPTPKDYEQFAKSKNIEQVIDRLMKTPAYGEHMAWRWLDAARYADSDGYESDPLRNMWPWRDWVVDAFNRHMPYDQFLVEQLAGDELKDASLKQVLATGFNRNHRLNNEGGVDPEEWLIEYVCDRAETTATVFMGLTWQCSRCHDHKYDPITQKDYYQLFSFFHQLPEIGNGSGARNAPPMIEVSALPYLDEFVAVQKKLKPLQDEFNQLQNSSEFKAAYAEWLKSLKEDEETRKKLPGDLAKKTVDRWDNKLKAQAKTHYARRVYEPAKELVARLTPVEKREAELRRTGAKVMVMGDREDKRTSYILKRGAFDQPTDPVTADTPHFLPAMNKDLPKNRLGLAKWLVDPSHPLTARVAVNREWARFFGTGLVKTQEDFGTQGERPSHPELLDYLASRFIESGWDLQELQKLILTSATYQQSSWLSPEILKADPENRLLARGPRYRLSAAVIRDQALAVSGLLVDDVGGAPVKPYQPEGLWREIIKGRQTYRRDTGEKLYRRSLYTLWRRAVKPPLMSLLDANGRDTCAVDLKRTNTPLQALLLLNDETFVEHSRALASRMVAEGGPGDHARIRYGFELVLGRAPSALEQKILQEELTAQRSYFQKNKKAVTEFLTVGDWAADAKIDTVELAAHASVARVLLNLDETMTKE